MREIVLLIHILKDYKNSKLRACKNIFSFRLSMDLPGILFNIFVLFEKNMNPTLRKYLPYIAAVVVFAVATLIYFKPLLSGKELRQDDIARHKGMSKEIADFRARHHTEPLWTNSMFGGMPAYQVSTLYPGNWLSTIDPLFKLFLPLPGGYLFLYFLGFFILLLCFGLDPWLALVGGLAYGLSSYFLIILEAGHNSKANALGYLPAMIGGVILIFRKRYWLGLALASLFTAMELNANHVQISYYGYIVVAFIVGGYFFHYLKEREIRTFAKGLGFFLLATFIGLLPNAAGLLTTNEYGKYSTRGKTELTIKSVIKKNNALDAKANDEFVSGPLKEQYEKNTTTGLDVAYATQWSYGIDETFTILIPDYKGGASNAIRSSDPAALKKVNPEFREQVGASSAYFGDQYFTSGPVYIGAIVVFLALLGMFIVKHSVKWPVFFATVLCVALSWGSHFIGLTNFFMHYVPGYNKFRAVSMLMIVPELTLPLLAMLAIHEILKMKSWHEKVKLRLINKEVALKRLVVISACVTGGFCALSYLAPDLVNSFQVSGEASQMVNEAVKAGNPEEQVKSYVMELMPQLELARKAIFKSDALRSLIFIALGFSMLYLFFTDKIKKQLLIGMLGLFIVIDLWSVDRRYINEKSFITKEQNLRMLTSKTEADEEILQDTALDYRVLNLTTSSWQDATTSYYHKSIGGYHGAKLRKYDELIDFHLKREVDHFYDEANEAFQTDSGTSALMSSLNVINMLNTRYFILPGGKGRESLPLRNHSANGNAWFVRNVHTVPTADDEIIGLSKIDTKSEAIVQAKFKNMLAYKDSYPGEGSIRLTSYLPNDLVYKSECSQEEFAVFSEIYYPEGWNAYLDGKPVPHIGVDYVLRGLAVPAGSHTIEFRFEPQTYSTGNSIAMAGSVLLLVTLGAGIYFHRRNNVIVS
jgi:hypothetical protein